MSKLIIRGGRVIDPTQSLDRVCDLHIAEGKIAGFNIDHGSPAKVIDAAGKIVVPGLIDMHVHLREPGREEDETIATGTAAALAGGFTAVACMPNTEPPLDTQAQVEFVQHQAARAGHCRVYVVACVSRDREGKELAELGMLARAGAVAFSDDGAPVYNPELMRRAFEYCLMLDRPILNHAEVRELTQGGVMHEGLTSLVLGLAGMPAAAEDVMVGRDLALAEATGGRIHVQHISTAGAVELVRQGKRAGIRVTTEVCPHHFCLTEESLRTFDSSYKMSPPLRSRIDVEACLEGLADGTIDCICTDHAPHAREKKMQELDRAPFGIIGLETALGLAISQLVDTGRLDWPALVEKMSCNPAKILGVAGGTLEVGGVADVTIIDPDYRWVVEPSKSRSKSRNTPFAGWELKGRAACVIVDGEVRFEAPG